jgi:hypothetical protein
LAVLQYETAKGHVPGHVNRFGGSTYLAGATSLSWVVVILPELAREDLWEEWRKPASPGYTYDDKRANFMPQMPQLICPSNSSARQKGGLSYVANCGIQDRGTEFVIGSGTWRYEGPEYGVFMNHFDPTLAQRCTRPNLAPSELEWKPIMVSTDRLSDGAQHTLMLSENIQATQWAPPLEPSGIAWTGYVPASQCAPNALAPDQREGHVGMVWWRQTPPACGRPNQCRDVEVQLYAGGVPVHPPTAGGNNFIDIARPSSFHTDGVVVTYSDGHQDFMLDDIDYMVFRRQMAPDDDKAGLPP